MRSLSSGRSTGIPGIFGHNGTEPGECHAPLLVLHPGKHFGHPIRMCRHKMRLGRETSQQRLGNERQDVKQILPFAARSLLAGDGFATGDPEAVGG